MSNEAKGNGSPLLKIEDLWVAVEGKEILKGVNLEIHKGEIHALMGPNGSGKSTLSNALMGHPKYEVVRGLVKLQGEDILELKPDERAKKGMFLAFQYPIAVPGVTVVNFLRAALKAVKENEITPREFRKLIKEKMGFLEMDDSFATRYVNDGFSGGEKKKLETLQMAVLQPQMAILDETDTGLDIDALKTVSEGVNRLTEENPELGILLITHYQRILNYIEPDQVHVLIEGQIVKSGGKELALDLEAKGYEWLEKSN